MQQLKPKAGGKVKDEVDLTVIETSLPVEFINEIQSALGPSQDYLETDAPWIRLPNETTDEYNMYLVYQGMPMHIWNMRKVFQEFDLYFNSKSLERVRFMELKAIAYKNQWHIRRFAYHMYLDWISSQDEMHQQLQLIADYRKSQGILTKKATEASIVLMEKVLQRIEDIGWLDGEGISHDNIRIQDIPKFLTAIKDITAMASDAEARLLSINMLLELHNKEIAQMFGTDGVT